VKFCQFGASLYPRMCTNFGRFTMIFNKNGVYFPRSTYHFYRFKFRVSISQIALTSSLMMSGPNSPNLNPLDYQVWGNAGVLTQATTEAKTSYRVLKCTLVNLVCLTEECHWQRCDRLPQTTANMCVSQRWAFWIFLCDNLFNRY